MQKHVQKKEINLECGYIYSDKHGTRKNEYHVDSFAVTRVMGNELPFGGNLSVRFPVGKKILFSFGHDECIFNKNSFSSKCWVGCNGERPLVPKDDGTGVMVSALQSREFGFGFRPLTNEELKKVNELRKVGVYEDVNAALKVFSTAKKRCLTESDNTFVREFSYGANKDGYWSYEHLIVQLEDCMDILKILFSEDDYEIQFLVDHSCGHDRQREDGLNINNMNREYGGKQRLMHSSIMSDGTLGKHNPTLKV